MTIMSDSDGLNGSIELTYRDIYRVYIEGLRRLIRKAPLAIVVLLSIAIIEGVHKYGLSSVLKSPIVTIEEFFGLSVIATIFILPFILIVILIRSIGIFVAWYRFPNKHRKISYLLNATGLITSDSTGLSNTIPWSLVTQARRRGTLIVIHTRPRGLRVLPLRAFSPADQARLWQFIQARLRHSASLKRPGGAEYGDGAASSSS
jgi:hypothetical protein